MRLPLPARLHAAGRLSALGLLLLLLPACGVRKETVPVSARYQQARTLSRPELAEWFRRLADQPATLVVKSVSMTFVTESARSLKREKLPTASGILIVTRAGDLRLQIMAPVIKTTVADIVSRGGRFEVWYPHKKTVYRGSMDDDLGSVSLAAGEDEKAPRYNLAKLRPWHITQTFFHAPLAAGSSLLVIEEDTPAERYYVLHEVAPGPGGEPQILQKIWLERSSLAISRKVLYDAAGAPVSDVSYRNYTAGGERSYPADITLRRPQEGYQVEFQIKRAEPDAPVNDGMFQLALPEDVTVKNIQAE